MTLVVSDISRHGVVMVGDSAITMSAGGRPVSVRGGASKVQYSETANIGFAVWGHALVAGRQIDRWLSDLIDGEIGSYSKLDDVAESVAEQLGRDLEKQEKPWSELRCGIHIAGYKNGLPRLWHVHCGHADEPAHEPRLYRDYPEGRGWSDDYMRVALLSEGGTLSCHLRNGYTPYYALLFNHVVDYANSLRESLGISFPSDSLMGQLEFHKVLVRFVAGVLVASGEHPGVNHELAAIAFTESGVQRDERLPVIDWLDGSEAQTSAPWTFAYRREPECSRA